jgi:hypothetical protein
MVAAQGAYYTLSDDGPAPVAAPHQLWPAPVTACTSQVLAGARATCRSTTTYDATTVIAVSCQTSPV